MNRNLSLLSFVFAVAATGYCVRARADDITIAPPAERSSVTRDEVRSELEAYRRSGVNPWARNYDSLRDFRSGRTRAEVTAEYLRERDAVARMNGEDSGSQYLAQSRHSVEAPIHMAGRRFRSAQH